MIISIPATGYLGDRVVAIVAEVDTVVPVPPRHQEISDRLATADNEARVECSVSGFGLQEAHPTRTIQHAYVRPGGVVPVPARHQEVADRLATAFKIERLGIKTLQHAYVRPYAGPGGCARPSPPPGSLRSARHCVSGSGFRVAPLGIGAIG